MYLGSPTPGMSLPYYRTRALAVIWTNSKKEKPPTLICATRYATLRESFLYRHWGEDHGFATPLELTWNRVNSTEFGFKLIRRSMAIDSQVVTGPHARSITGKSSPERFFFAVLRSPNDPWGIRISYDTVNWATSVSNRQLTWRRIGHSVSDSTCK
jgi:hypothetical protein